MVKNIRNKSILVVEDDESLRRAMEKVLSSEGCIVTEAGWAAEAMEQLADPQNHFDLVIMDLQMPFVRGSTILQMAGQYIRPGRDPSRVAGDKRDARPAAGTTGRDIPVIVLTAFGSPELKAECFRLGAAAFLEKPLDTVQLLAVIRRVFPPSRGRPAKPPEQRTPGKVDPQ